MLATFDVDNTRVAVGVFDGADLKASFTIASDVRRTEDEYAFILSGMLAYHGVPPAAINAVALASVVPPLTEPFERLTQRLFNCPPLVVGAGTRTGIRIATQNPKEVGANRIVNAAGVFRLYGGPAIVLEFGTATSFDVVGKDGAYLGSVIAPGLILSAEALFQHAARLSHVDLVSPRTVVGRDTAGAVQSGALLGHAEMVNGLLRRIRQEMEGPCVVVATGENLQLILPELLGVDHVEPHLSLVGLRLLYELNQDGR